MMIQPNIIKETAKNFFPEREGLSKRYIEFRNHIEIFIDDDFPCSSCYHAPMKFGFTGSRLGMTPQQKDLITRLEVFTTKVLEAHYEDCLGSDADFHHYIRESDQANCIEKRLLSLVTQPENLNQRGLIASLDDSKK